MTVSSGEATTLRSPITHPQPSHSQNSMSDSDLPTGAESMWTESTPPTSSSTFSSQEKSHLSQHQPLSLGYPPAGALNHPDGPRAPIYTKPSEVLRPCPTNDSGETLVAGQKRTANGEVKISKPAHTPMYHDLTASTHSRNTSSVSNGSLTELSQQLRTRLSYAFVKVQNGWQSNTLDEVESLASHGSPRSSTSTTANPHYYSSPRTEVNARLRRQWSGSQSSSSTSSDQQSTRYLVSQTSKHNQEGDLPLLSSLPSLPAASSTSTVNLPPKTQQYLLYKEFSKSPSLAPPVDIHSSSASGRPHSKSRTQIAINPSTPPRPPRPAQRTPSQNAAMEADAIETLLFMSSPGNSGRYAGNGGSAQTSPLRSAFTERDGSRNHATSASAGAGQKVGFAVSAAGRGSDGLDATRQHAKQRWRTEQEVGAERGNAEYSSGSGAENEAEAAR